MGVNKSIDISPEARQTVEELLQRYVPGATVWAYGSRVKWTARPESDLDLVVFAGKDQRGDVANLREALEESDLPFRVDVFIWDEVPEKFREEIREGYVVMQEGGERRLEVRSENSITRSPNHWRLVTLAELCEESGGDIQTGPFGSQLHASDYVAFGTPSIMPKNISVEGIDTADIARISEEDATRLSRYLVRDGDIIYSRRGDVEKCALVTQAEEGWLCGTGCLRIRLGVTASISVEFLHAYLSHPAVREWIVRHAIGATMPNLNTSILTALPVPVPSDIEQATIGRFWRKTIRKIQLNRQMNQTLETIAQTIFKSWFVDFDPVKAKQAAKALGRDPERAAMAALSGKLRIPKNTADLPTEALAEAEAELEQLGEEERKQLERTAALFPDGFVESELGLIPEGWKIAPLVDACDIISGGTPKTSVEAYWNGSIPWASAKDVSQCSETFLISTERSITAEGLMNSASKLIDPDITVVVARGATTGRMTMFGKQIAMNQTCYGLRAKNGAHFFLYCLCQSFLPQIVHAGHGSVFNTITTSTFRQSKVLIPNDSVALLFHHLTTPLYRSIQSSIEQIFLIAQLRDTLLPKLLSGEISLCDTEAQTFPLTP